MDSSSVSDGGTAPSSVRLKPDSFSPGGRSLCVKCLLQEYDEEKYRQIIANEIEWMDKEMRTDDKEYRRRLDICRECDRLTAGTCLKCGCYVELRAAAKKGSCPGKKW